MYKKIVFPHITLGAIQSPLPLPDRPLNLGRSWARPPGPICPWGFPFTYALTSKWTSVLEISVLRQISKQCAFWASQNAYALTTAVCLFHSSSYKHSHYFLPFKVAIQFNTGGGRVVAWGQAIIMQERKTTSRHTNLFFQCSRRKGKHRLCNIWRNGATPWQTAEPKDEREGSVGSGCFVGVKGQRLVLGVSPNFFYASLFETG